MPPSPQSLPAEVRKATYLGAYWDYQLATEIGELFITQPEGARHAQGSAVHLTLDADRLALVVP